MPENVIGFFAVLGLFAPIPILVIGLIYYFKKRLEHKEILAAIEKGVPVSELNLGEKKSAEGEGPGWIRDQSKGITLLVIGIGIGLAFLPFLGFGRAENPTMHVMWIVPIVFLGNGIGLLIRSNMRRKYEKTELQEQPPSEA